MKCPKKSYIEIPPFCTSSPSPPYILAQNSNQTYFQNTLGICLASYRVHKARGYDLFSFPMQKVHIQGVSFLFSFLFPLSPVVQIVFFA